MLSLADLTQNESKNLEARMFFLLTWAITKMGYSVTSNNPIKSMIVAWFIVISFFMSTGAQTTNDILYTSPSSTSDFVIRWQYQYFCDHVYDSQDSHFWPTPKDKLVKFNPKNVKPGDTIFIRKASRFFKEMHPKIEHPYIVVSAGDSQDQMIDEYKGYLNEDKVIAWFGVHPNKMAMTHPKFHPLPLGIMQDHDFYDEQEELNDEFRELREEVEKKHLVYMNFSTGYGDRKHVRELFLNKPYCKTTDNGIAYSSYLEEMAECYFALSPEGTGPDCYRTYEALLVGSIPIVKRSQFDVLFEDLPVLIIDTWEQAANETFLKEALKKITSKKYTIEKLYTHYWTSKIQELQQKFRKNNA